MSDGPENKLTALERLIFLAGRSHVGAYTRRSVAGNIVHVDSYWRSKNAKDLSIGETVMDSFGKEHTVSSVKGNTVSFKDGGTGTGNFRVKPEGPQDPMEAAKAKRSARRATLWGTHRGEFHAGPVSAAKTIPAGKPDPKEMKASMESAVRAFRQRFDETDSFPTQKEINAEAKARGLDSKQLTSALAAIGIEVNPNVSAVGFVNREIPKASPSLGLAWQKLSPPIPFAGSPTGAGTLYDPVDVGDDLELAVQLIAEGKHVRLKQRDEVATLLNKLEARVQHAIRHGEKAPNYNLCLVEVPKTNLFCTQSKGVPRAMMPQLGGRAVEGSRAWEIRDEMGNAEGGPAFFDWLKVQGVGITKKTVLASHLRSTQTELDGPKVAEIAAAMKAGKVPESTIFVTRDGYIIDGHHRWAGKVALDLEAGSDKITMPVYMIDMDIGAGIDYARAFATDFGIKPEETGAFADNPGTGVNDVAKAPLVDVLPLLEPATHVAAHFGSMAGDLINEGGPNLAKDMNEAAARVRRATRSFISPPEGRGRIRTAAHHLAPATIAADKVIPDTKPDKVPTYDDVANLIGRQLGAEYGVDGFDPRTPEGRKAADTLAGYDYLAPPRGDGNRTRAALQIADENDVEFFSDGGPDGEGDFYPPDAPGFQRATDMLVGYDVGHMLLDPFIRTAQDPFDHGTGIHPWTSAVKTIQSKKDAKAAVRLLPGLTQPDLNDPLGVQRQRGEWTMGKKWKRKDIKAFQNAFAKLSDGEFDSEIVRLARKAEELR